jgi:hypothetical protein
MVALEVSTERRPSNVSQEMRALIRRLSRENVLWSAETIHGHLVLHGFDSPCPDTIRKYMVKPKGGTDKAQSWLTFLRNHSKCPGHGLLRGSYSWLSNPVHLGDLESFPSQVVHFAVTAHPTQLRLYSLLAEEA